MGVHGLNVIHLYSPFGILIADTHYPLLSGPSEGKATKSSKGRTIIKGIF